jgi:LPPG:FO 2-phospho-L-lactate transferase
MRGLRELAAQPVEIGLLVLGGGRGHEPDRQVNVVLLTGGLGGARLAPRLRDVLGPGRLTVIANVGDDLEWLGLRVCPDVDSVLYALAGCWDEARGWGRRDETFGVRDALGELGLRQWFNVGDRDLATHLRRCALLRGGRTPTEATSALAGALGIRDVTVLPAADERAETRVLTADGRRLHFQEWYVRERAEPRLRGVELAVAPAGPAALAALAVADAVVLGPSNPVASLGAILALGGIRDAVAKVPRRIAVSPLVAAVPPGDGVARHHARARERLLAAEGCRHTPAAIARRYAGLVDCFLLDRADTSDIRAVARDGVRTVAADLLEPARLARALASELAQGPR